MSNEHLTDEQIQNILDSRMLKAGSILPLHLGTCASCQKRLDSFRQLYAGLAADPGFALPPAFADSVLDKISASRPVFWERPAAKIAMAIGTAAVILAGLAHFCGHEAPGQGHPAGLRHAQDGVPASGRSDKAALFLDGRQRQAVPSRRVGPYLRCSYRPAPAPSIPAPQPLSRIPEPEKNLLLRIGSTGVAAHGSFQKTDCLFFRLWEPR